MNRTARMALFALVSITSAAPAFAHHGGPHAPVIALHGDGHWQPATGPRAAPQWVLASANRTGQPAMSMALRTPQSASHKNG